MADTSIPACHAGVADTDMEEEVMALDAVIEVVYELEPICKLACQQTACTHNLSNSRELLHCNLKHLDIDSRGRCVQMRLRSTVRSVHAAQGYIAGVGENINANT